MTTDAAERKALACDLVSREAALLDQQDWDGWLACYEDDGVFWMPMWRDETTLTRDPQTELSFIRLEGRALLAERVARVTGGRSVAAMPVPRTAHLVTGSLVTHEGDDDVSVRSAWSCHVYRHKDASLTTYAGRYEHRLRWSGDRFRIRSKTVVVINDRLQSQVDFFHV